MLSNIVLSQIGLISILILFGIMAKKYNIIEEKAELSLANIVIDITVPSLVFYSVTSDIELDKILQGIIIPVICIVMIIVIMGLAFISTKLVKINSKNIGTFIVLASMPNSGFLGFPIIYSIFGQEGLTYAVLFDIGVTIIFYSLSIIVLKGTAANIKFSWKTVFNPPILAFSLGLLIKFFHINIPALVLDSFRIMGNSTIPLAMLIMGVNLSKIKLQKKIISIKELFMISTIKLLAFPIITYIILMMLDLNPVIKSVILVESAMPSMASTPILVEKYGGNMNLSTTAIFITTILAIFTIPAIIFYFE